MNESINQSMNTHIHTIPKEAWKKEREKNTGEKRLCEEYSRNTVRIH